MKKLVYAFFNSIFQAVKMTSVKMQVPYDYYTLPFCDPIKKYYVPENLGICLFVGLILKKLLGCFMLDSAQYQTIWLFSLRKVWLFIILEWGPFLVRSLLICFPNVLFRREKKSVESTNIYHICQDEQALTLSIMSRLNAETLKCSLPFLSFVKANSWNIVFLGLLNLYIALHPYYLVKDLMELNLVSI